MPATSMRSTLQPTLLALALCLILAGQGLAAETLAILPFENNSLSEAERYQPLAKGLAAMLTSDMGRKIKGLKLVERTRIDKLLKEMHLGMTGAVDEESAAQAGKVLGARHIALGAFTILGEEVRLDIRVIAVETSEVVATAAVFGKSGEILGLIADLAGKIAASFQQGLVADSAEGQGRGRLEAALSFSRGVTALDNGDEAEAREWFAQCLASDPSYRAQIELLTAPR